MTLPDVAGRTPPPPYDHDLATNVMGACGTWSRHCSQSLVYIHALFAEWQAGTLFRDISLKFSNLSSKYFIASDFPARNAVRGEVCKDC